MTYRTLSKEASFFQKHPIWSTLIIELIFYLMTTLLLPAIFPVLRNNPVYITNIYSEQQVQVDPSIDSVDQTIQAIHNNVNNERLSLVRLMAFIVVIITTIIISMFIYIRRNSDISEKDKNTLQLFLVICLILTIGPLLYIIPEIFAKIKSWAPIIVQ